MDLDFHLHRGNHQSELKHDTVLEKLIKYDIIGGFALLLPIFILPLFPNASSASLGCHEQETINQFGELIPKYRITHSQSFKGPSGLSVNL
jgi:hypothetical protein